MQVIIIYAYRNSNHNFNKNHYVVAFWILMSKNVLMIKKTFLSLSLSDHFKHLYEFRLLTRSWKQVWVFFSWCLTLLLSTGSQVASAWHAFVRDKWSRDWTGSTAKEPATVFLFLFFSIIPRLVLGWNSSIKVEFTGLPVESWNILLISCDTYRMKRNIYIYFFVYFLTYKR